MAKYRDGVSEPRVSFPKKTQADDWADAQTSVSTASHPVDVSASAHARLLAPPPPSAAHLHLRARLPDSRTHVFVHLQPPCGKVLELRPLPECELIIFTVGRTRVCLCVFLVASVGVAWFLPIHFSL